MYIGACTINSHSKLLMGFDMTDYDFEHLVWACLVGASVMFVAENSIMFLLMAISLATGMAILRGDM